jgi:hypothetical protein
MSAGGPGSIGGSGLRGGRELHPRNIGQIEALAMAILEDDDQGALSGAGRRGRCGEAGGLTSL